jgi:FkbM family methyltransferase
MDVLMSAGRMNVTAAAPARHARAFSSSALVQRLLVMWAKTGKAPGLLYSFVERHGHEIAGVDRQPRRLANGLILECDLRDHVQQQIYFFGAYEPIEVALFASLIPPGGVAVDAGANVGFYTLMMAEQVGARGQVHAFEPVPDNYERLARHIEINGKSHVTINPMALWDKNEILELGLPTGHRFNCGAFNAKSRDGGRVWSCPATTLSRYFEERHLTRLDAIKMDIEGAELFALRGAWDLVARYRPVILLEVCKKTCQRFGYSPDALWMMLKPHGYRIYKVGAVCADSGWLSDFSNITQNNVILVPEEHASRLNETWDDKQIRAHYLKFG